MEIKIFDINNRLEYNNFLLKLKIPIDIYYQIEFLEVDSQIQNGIFEIFTLTYHNDYFIYPYIKLAIPFDGFQDFYDISSPYGYGGPICSSQEFLKIAEKQFEQYSSKSVISEFIRYHYSYNEKIFFSHNVENIHNRTVCVIDLNNNWDEIWLNQFSPTNRNLVRKLEKDNFEFEICNDKTNFFEFTDLYYETMKNVNAETFYFFDKQLLWKQFCYLGDKNILAKVTKDGITYCSALFYISDGIITYYLSARNLNYTKIPATNFLLSKITEWGIKMGYKVLNLGGGLSNNSDDHLFKFKSNFTKDTFAFYIGKRVHNNELYQKIKEQFILLNGEEQYNFKKHLLHFYR
jgi:lipid II:glycine glycyltransferase (peptidoglycan interpeptide bridge formation enzyme)